jgi:hypothetical protein
MASTCSSWFWTKETRTVEKTEPTLFFDVHVSSEGVSGTIFTAISQVVYITLVMRMRCQILNGLIFSDNNITLVGSQQTSYVDHLIKFQSEYLLNQDRSVNFMTVLFACLYHLRSDFVTLDGSWMALQMSSLQMSILLTRKLEIMYKTTLYFEVVEKSHHRIVRSKRIFDLNDNLPFLDCSCPFKFDAPLVKQQGLEPMLFDFNFTW